MVIACRACGIGWREGTEPLCHHPDHEHSRHERHRHRTPVVLPSGTVVWAASFEESEADNYARDAAPSFGLYFDEKWTPPWDHEVVPFPDFGVPSDVDLLRQHLAAVLVRARAGERIELGCWGAHGRTGTAVACLAVLDGLVPDTAVAWVRDNYCARAIETADQEAFVAAFPTT